MLVQHGSRVRPLRRLGHLLMEFHVPSSSASSWLDGAAVYKHAYGHRRDSDEEDSRREDLRAAGIRPRPRACAKFVLRTRKDLNRIGVNRDTPYLASRLNLEGLRNAKGEKWTSPQVRAFIAQFM
jgi:hypothetical protein